MLGIVVWVSSIDRGGLNWKIFFVYEDEDNINYKYIYYGYLYNLWIILLLLLCNMYGFFLKFFSWCYVIFYISLKIYFKKFDVCWLI